MRLGNRALTLLIALVEKNGELVSKEELITRVWPDTFVEEANLRVHVAALRKVLGGHQRSAAIHRQCQWPRLPLRCDNWRPRSRQARAASLRRDGGPASLTRIIGRQEEVATLLDRVTRRRLITVSGPGGIGKTTVAFAVAQKLQEAFDDGIVTVDLGAAAPDADSLPQAIAMALKVSVAAGDPLPSLVAFLRDRHLLLLLDNCEHIIDAVTEIAEQMLRQAPRLHILATSTEPMRAEGEWIFRLLPLEIHRKPRIFWPRRR